MRVVFAGTPESAIPSLDAIHQSENHELIAVITQPDAQSGRGRRVARSAVARRAEELGIPLLQPENISDPAFVDELNSLQPDCCPIVAYGQLLKKNVLTVPKFGWINLHFSLLPLWRGAAPVQWAIRAGDEVTGASTFLLEEGMDTGPIIGSITENIRNQDTTLTLMERLATSGAALLVESLDALEQGIASPLPQNNADATYTKKISTDDARIEWNLPAHIVSRRIRSVTPAPGAWSELNGKRMKIGSVMLADTSAVQASAQPGQLIFDGKRLWVRAADDYLNVIEIQAPGKRMMSAADWARGARLTGDEILR